MRHEVFGEGKPWLDKWDNFIDLRSGFPVLPADAQTITPPRALRLFNTGRHIVAAPRFHSYCDALPKAYLAMSFQFIASGLAPFIVGLIGPVLALRCCRQDS